MTFKIPKLVSLLINQALQVCLNLKNMAKMLLPLSWKYDKFKRFIWCANSLKSGLTEITVFLRVWFVKSAGVMLIWLTS